MDITQLILDDHHEQRRLFAIIEQLDDLAALHQVVAVFARGSRVPEPARQLGLPDATA